VVGLLSIVAVLLFVDLCEVMWVWGAVGSYFGFLWKGRCECDFVGKGNYWRGNPSAPDWSLMDRFEIRYLIVILSS